MKKLITLSLIALFAIGNLMAFDMNWNGEARVRAGLVMNDGWNSDNPTTTWKAQRIRLFWNGVADNGVKFVVRSHLSKGDVSGDTKNINLDRAYIVVPDALLGFTVTAGLLPFYACNGLVIDDNMPGYYFNGAFGDVSVGFGGFTVSEGSTTKYSNFQGATVAKDDAHALMANFSMNNVGPGTVGLDVMAKTNVTVDTLHSKANYFWVSPWYNLNLGDFSCNINPTIMFGSYDKGNRGNSTAVSHADSVAADVSGTVFALSIKPSYTLAATGTSLSGDFLYITGKKSTDTDKLGWRNISSFYCSGLEWFGSANEIDNYGAVGNFAGDNGQISLIVKADQPLTSALTLHFAAGQFMYAEDVKWEATDKGTKKAGSDNVLGTEIDLGLRWAVKENVTWKFTAAYVIPGDASTTSAYSASDSRVYNTGNDDAITSLTTYLGYSF